MKQFSSLWKMKLAALALTLAMIGPASAEAEMIPYGLDSLASAHYSIDVQLDTASGALSGDETVLVANTYDEDLRELVFNVTPARSGAEQITTVEVDGNPVAYGLDGVVLSIPLPRPLRPGASTEVSIEFEATVPSPGDMRFGRSRGILALGNWYPVLGIYQPGQGWDRHPYVDTGDAFATISADYDVKLIISPGSSTVAHTGTLAGHDGNVWRMQAKGVRDFAIAVAQRYVSSSAEVDGVRITAYYLPEHAAGGAIYIQTAAEALRWYNKVLGKYPFGELTIAESSGNDPGWVGQEYPNIVFIGSTSSADPGNMGDYLSYAVAHEIAHQWFYSLVGNDQVYEPWVDEAFASYVAYQYLRTYYPSAYDSFWNRLQRTYQAAATNYGRRPVNSSIYDFRGEEHYYAMVYRQGALFLEDLRQSLGESTFWQLLRDYVTRHSFGMASGRDFLSLAQERSAGDLKPLFGRYFSAGLFASDADYDIPNGHFYTQANGQTDSRGGFAVTNRDGVRFWDEFQRLGGVSGVGYPASRRFVWDGFVSQVFQKGVFQWRPEVGAVYLVNVFDQIGERGLDAWLRSTRDTPARGDWTADGGMQWANVVSRHQQVLDANAAIRARYAAAADPITLYGLPMAPVTDMGDAYVLRAQRVVIQQWKLDVPWAKSGEVTVANGGDIAKEAGLVPLEALRLENPPD